jgi:hypothetical protein
VAELVAEMALGALPTPAADHGAGSSWKNRLESALEQLGRVGRLLENGAEPVADLRRAADEFAACLGALFEAYDLLADPIAGIRQARLRLATMRQVLSVGVESSAALGFAVECCDQAAVELAHAEDLVVGLPLPPAPKPAPLRASGREPRLHALARPRLLPQLRVPEQLPQVVAQPAPPIAAPQTFEELESAIAELRRRADDRRQQAEAKNKADSVAPGASGADSEPPPGFARDRLSAWSDSEFMRQRARECFEEIVMVGIQRLPIEGDNWRGIEVLERRLLANLDALVALGPAALAWVEPLVMDFPVRDPSRVWATTVLFGSIAGRDALAVAERVFEASVLAAPESTPAFASALKLVQHPNLGTSMRRLLFSPAPAQRALAVEVLAHHGLITSDELLRASDDVPEVAARALPFFALSGHSAVRTALDRAMMQDDDALREAAWTAMLYAQHPGVRYGLRAELNGPRAAVAAHLLAISALEADVAELESAVRQGPTPALLDALGWAGAPSSVELLLAVLQEGDAALQKAAVAALSRITGYRPLEEVLVAPEELEILDSPDPPGEPPDPSLAQLVSDPRDLPEDGSPDVVERVSADPAIWLKFWAERKPEFNPGSRYRRGVPHSALAVWNELDAGPCSFAERCALSRELILASGGYVPFDPGDFVARQEARLLQWEAVARAGSVRLGSYGVPRRSGGYTPRA